MLDFERICSNKQIIIIITFQIEGKISLLLNFHGSSHVANGQKFNNT